MSTMTQEEQEKREEMVYWARSIFERCLTPGSSGNMSVKLSDGWLITPTNSCFGRLDPAQISKLDVEGQHVSGAPPSKEAFLHRAFYDHRPNVGAIVHLHSTYCAAVSCLSGLDPENAIPPITPYFVMKIGKLPLVPYLRPGHSGLGDAIAALAKKHSAVLLANHGPVVSGKNLSEAVFSTEELEETAKLFLLLHGKATQALNTEQIDELKHVFKLDF